MIRLPNENGTETMESAASLDEDFGEELKFRRLDPKKHPNEIILGLTWDKKAKRPGGPVTLRRELLQGGHMHIRGRTRSGKTSLVIAPLLQQLLIPYEIPYKDASNREQIATVKDSVFVFDLGGDLGLFNLALNAAREASGGERTFRFLSLEPDDASHYFDPFQAVRTDKKDRLIRIANLLIQAFHLDYGLIYGGSYYTQRNLSALLRVASRLRDESDEGEIPDIDYMAKYLKETKQKDEEEIRFTFQFLTEYDQLKPPKEETDNVIDMQRALPEGEVVSFLCPTMGEATTARQIAGLGLYTLINAAMQRVRHRSEEDLAKPLPHAWVFVDEFQELAGRSFAALLAQSSKFGMSLIMANQTTTQLKTRDLDLADVVRDNTLAKVYFTVTGRQDIEDLQAFSKEARIRLRRKSTSHQVARATVSDGYGETLATVLKKDEILDTSGSHKHCYLILDDGQGHHEPHRLWTHYAIDGDTYRQYKNTPPEKAQGAKRAKPKEPSPQRLPWMRKNRSEGAGKRQEQLRALLARKTAQERPDEVASRLMAKLAQPENNGAS